MTELWNDVLLICVSHDNLWLDNIESDLNLKAILKSMLLVNLNMSIYLIYFKWMVLETDFFHSVN